MKLVHVLVPPLASFVLASGTAMAQVDAPPPKPGSSDCAQVAGDLAVAYQARRKAETASQQAWKALVPVAVAAKYAKSQSDLGAANERVAQLEAESRRLGCSRAGGALRLEPAGDDQ